MNIFFGKKIALILLVFAPFLSFAQNIPMTFHNGSFFPNGKNGKKEILFTVSPTWKKDTILQIDEIIKTRKKSLG